MNDPYRTITPKEDIINVRLDSLEKTASRAANVIIAVIMTVAVMAACLLANTLYFRSQKSQGACRSEIKVLPRPGAAMTANLTCDHPDQRMTHSITGKEVVVTCTCHGDH